MLKEIKAASLQARKDRDTVRANLLGTVLSDVQVRAKDDGNREPTDKDAQKVVDKFLKSNAQAIELRSTEQLVREREILQEFAALVPVSTVDHDALVAKLIAENPEKFEAAKTNAKLFGFFTGQAMKLTGGQADAKVFTDKLTVALNG